jgi:hypothetical protein
MFIIIDLLFLPEIIQTGYQSGLTEKMSNRIAIISGQLKKLHTDTEEVIRVIRFKRVIYFPDL